MTTTTLITDGALNVIILSSPVTGRVVGQWTIPVLDLQAGGPGLDLSLSLPPSAKKGGTFSLNSGTLETGLTLTPAGIIQAAQGAADTTLSGLVFKYAEPGS